MTEKSRFESVKLRNSVDTFHSNLSEVCPEHRITYLTNLHLSLMIAADAASDAAAASHTALHPSSNLAAKDGLNNITFPERKFGTTLETEKLASERVSDEVDLRMENEGNESMQVTIKANDASTSLIMNLQRKYDAAATAAAEASYSSLIAQRLAFKLASEMALMRDESIQAAPIPRKASALLLANLQLKYEAAATAAADLYDSTLVAQRLASQLATEEAELKANSRMTTERNTSKLAAILAWEASNAKLMDQKSKFEAMAVAAADASDSSLMAERLVSQLATEVAELEANSRMASERNESKQAALIASEVSASKLWDQRSKYEAAATTAADVHDSTLVAQRLASQLATEEAELKANSRMTTERNALKQAAITASEVSDSKFLDQKSKYEIAAIAAADASDSKMAIEQALFAIATKLASEAFAQKLTDNTKNTERLELQAKFAIMESEQLRSISANVAHDLKSPLHTLLIGLESMRQGNDLNSNMSRAQNEEMLDTLNSACAFMTSAISRTIEFSKTSTGISLTPSNTSFNLEAALNNPMKWMNAMLPLNGKKSLFMEPVPEGITTLISDQHWAEENLLCLLSNAIKYSDKGIIRVILALKDGMVSVTVEDNGIGISAESKLLLFKPFSKLQNSAVGSTGLGLYSLSKRTEAIGGSCGVNDRSDGQQGSSFWFTFPYLPDICEEDESSPSHETENKGLVLANQCLDILIVDDSTSVVKILSNKLAGVGHRVVDACNGAEGLEKMIKMAGKLDVVFMDIQMPVMDGIEATKRYREVERNHGLGQHLPIICSSANFGREADELALSAGVDSFLPKPFSTAVLLGVIENVMKGRM